MCIDRVARAISEAKGQTRVAEKLSDITGKRVKQSRVSMWIFRGRVPPEWVIPLETALFELGVEMTRYDIRPDLYPRSHAA